LSPRPRRPSALSDQEAAAFCEEVLSSWRDQFTPREGALPFVFSGTRRQQGTMSSTATDVVIASTGEPLIKLDIDAAG